MESVPPLGVNASHPPHRPKELPAMTSNQVLSASHRIVSREAWKKARVALLQKEKELTRLRDQLSGQRRSLPWVKVDKNYTFDGPTGPATLADLFAARSQLFIKHFMMGPGQQNPCVGCSLEVDHLDGLLVHLENHDVSYAAVARAPIEQIEAFRSQMGWRFPWVSSFRNDFNADFQVSFTPEQLEARSAEYNFRLIDPGLADLSGNSVFFMDEEGQIFHTYSAYSRGGEQFLGIYGFLDVMPKGRGEDGPYHTLGDWARPRTMYGKGGMVEPTGRYHASSCACTIHR
jgi:predicted dithiol-disulfide oxidoreductase (DUF899 family)